MKLQSHNIILEGKTTYGLNVKLRPMTEEDWPVLNKWNSDSEILYYADTDDITSYSPELVKRIYRNVSKTAYCFITEVNKVPVGECWLQEMNLDWILKKYPDFDCRRIDLMIGEKDFWGQGIGTVVINLLTEFAFLKENADFIFGCYIADYNKGSLKIFKKCGYKVLAKMKQEEGAKSDYSYFLFSSREEFLSSGGAHF